MAKNIHRYYDPELIFGLLAENNWKELFSFIGQNPQVIDSDPITKNAIDTCENVFFLQMNDSQDEAKLLTNLETFYLFHKEKKRILSSERFTAVVRRMVQIWKVRDLSQAYERARHCPADPVCASVIKEYEDTRPHRIVHSQVENLSVVENKKIADRDARRSLFKSPQEKEFFAAVQEVYPQFIVFPNVALSTIIDFDLIVDHLSAKAKDYFFKAVLDCAVFDYRLDLPKFFFELDSSYHDNPAQMEKDALKNSIFSAAGLKLHRIRRVAGGEKTRADFTRLIRELIG